MSVQTSNTFRALKCILWRALQGKETTSHDLSLEGIVPLIADDLEDELDGLIVGSLRAPEGQAVHILYKPTPLLYLEAKNAIESMLLKRMTMEETESLKKG